MIIFPVHDPLSPLSIGSYTIIAQQMLLFILSLCFKSDILLEISYPMGMWLESLFLFHLVTLRSTVSMSHLSGITMMTIWSFRLLLHLIFRMERKHRDNSEYSRFQSLWENKLRLFTYLIFQYLTIFSNNLASIAMFYPHSEASNHIERVSATICSITLFVIGMGISTIADHQKLKYDHFWKH